MILHFYKYQGAGNDFILLDIRSKKILLNTKQIQFLCDRHFGIGADGLMLLENSNNADFKMVYFNSDGRESTMCGNGGRCIVAFAKHLGIIQNQTTFEAIDGLHYAEVLQNNIIRLQMKDVDNITNNNEDFVLNTGSPHFVKIVHHLDDINVFEEGRKIRYSPNFNKEGINVNFMEIVNNENIKVRTYERGVENETLACGTGVTACAIIADYILNLKDKKVNVQTRGGRLVVEFQKNDSVYHNVFLTGNANFVFKGEIQI
ncbi:MAG: diaminopimelate epimerase [Bacteroidia bacterium]|nr:MAG: diaminopimelate epimerase [Bacteroidia bacterium]